MTHGAGPGQPPTADELLDQVAAGLPADEAALALALVVHRASTRLHNLARTEAVGRKGQAEWPAWAALQNAARAALLQASTCRDFANKLAGRRG